MNTVLHLIYFYVLRWLFLLWGIETVIYGTALTIVLLLDKKQEMRKEHENHGT